MRGVVLRYMRGICGSPLDVTPLDVRDPRLELGMDRLLPVNLRLGAGTLLNLVMRRQGSSFSRCSFVMVLSLFMGTAPNIIGVMLGGSGCLLELLVFLPSLAELDVAERKFESKSKRCP